MVRVGIPRALLYYQYYPMWKVFFEALGAEVVVSPPTTSEIVASGCSRLSAEICLPVRIFCGHALFLVNKCDYVFVPSIRSVEKRAYNCPKFIGLPDLIRANVAESPPILDPDIDVNRSRRELYLSIYKLAQVFTDNPIKIKKAVDKALRVHSEYRMQMSVQKLTPPQAIEQMFSGSKIIKIREFISDITLALIGHPYLLYDEYSNHRLTAKLERNGVNILFPEMINEKEQHSHLVQLVGSPYWTYEGEVIGAGEYYLRKGTDGVISVAAFGCGPDSLMLELVRRRAQKLNKPFLNLVIDEHTAEAGLITRLDAFVDMVRWRKRLKSQHFYISQIPLSEKEATEKIGVLGIPNFGNISAAIKTVAKMLNISIVAVPATKRTLSLGTRYSPEFVCIPFKFILGGFIEALEQGADTLFFITSLNACRLGYYAKAQEQILRDLGYNFSFLKFKSSEKGLFGVLKAIKRIANNAPWATVIAAYRLGTAKLKALDDIERQVQKCRAAEVDKGMADSIYREAIKTIAEAPDLLSLKQVVCEYLEKLNRVPRIPEIVPLKVGIVGEIYVVMEPFVNMNLEVELGKLGVEVRRTKSTFFSEWARLGAFNVLNEEKQRLRKFALPYLRRDVGGHGFESLAEKIRLSGEGYDGIVHLAPFTCMPEAIAGNIMPSTVENIPVLTILCDEQLAKAGLLTRLEAFVDLLKWRRQKLSFADYLRFSGGKGE